MVCATLTQCRARLVVMLTALGSRYDMMTTPLSHYVEILKLTSYQPPSPASLAARLTSLA